MYVDAFREAAEGFSSGVAVLRAQDWTVTDSVPLTDSTTTRIGGLAAVPSTINPERGDIAVRAPRDDSLDHLLLLDGTSLEIRDSLTLGEQLAVTGDFIDSRGMGFIAVYDSERERMPDIDLDGDPIVEGFSPRIASVAVGPDDRFLYVPAGSASGGSFPPARYLYVIEIETGEIVRKIELGLFGIDAVDVLSE